MNKSITLAAATALTTSAFAVEARTSSPADFRGYQACVAAAERNSSGLVTTRHYYLEKEAGSTFYYINATRWNEGERDSVRIACETTNRGHKLVSSVIEQGRFSQAPSESQNVEIAQN